MRVRLRRGMLNCSVRLWVPGSTARCDRRIGADDQARLRTSPAANTSARLSAVAVTRTCASMYCTASRTDGDTSMAGRVVPRHGPSLRRRRCCRRCALLVRRLGTPLPPAEIRLSLPEIEGGGRAVARPPPQPGELRYIAGAAA